MSETRKAPASAATLTRAVENVAVCETAQPSTKDSIISAAGSQPLKIADFLSPGQQNARPLRYLKELTGLPGREVRRMIQSERSEGIPVLSDNSAGYYLPADDQERERFIKSMRHRAGEILKLAAAIKQGGDGA